MSNTRRKINYNAQEYSDTKQQSPFRTKVEMHTIFSLVGDPRGLRVVDAGCGDGIYARMLVDRGAKHVIGVDCDADFIAAARAQNAGYESSIEYDESFIQDFNGYRKADLVVGSFIMSYPQNAREVGLYCDALAQCLRPGGRFVGYGNNTFEIFSGERYKKYGFTKSMYHTHEGAEVVYQVEGMSNPIVNFHIHPKTYERAFRRAGFSEFAWVRAGLTPHERGIAYWDDFFTDEPPFIAMVARL